MGLNEPQEALYKVLVRGKSAHGGDLAWSLPVKHRMRRWVPGQWHEVQGKLIPCKHGLHLTTKPEEWYKDDCEVFVAEHRGESIKHERQKVIVRAARLIAPVLFPSWVFSGYGSGSGDGYGYGSGSGSGSGDGYGSGYGYGDGSGDGSGDGYGSGYGYGDGSGDGLLDVVQK